MSPITTSFSDRDGGSSATSIHDFQSDLPLHPKAAQLLEHFFSQGWPDPAKIHHRSSQSRILISEAKEEIASVLGRGANELEFVGELGFGFWSSIAGLLPQSPSSQSDPLFLHSTIDRQVIHAFARRYQAQGGPVQQLPVDSNGRFEIPSSAGNSPRIICWQGTNRESGVVQKRPEISTHDSLFADMTGAMPDQTLPDGWSVALWDPQKYGAPQGIAILAIARESHWRSPLPPMDNRRTFGSYSKPLLLATAVAMTSFVEDLKSERSRISQMRRELVLSLKNSVPDLRAIDDGVATDPRYVALGIPGVIGEELVRQMEILGFLIDAGSACGAGPLSPSHVFDAMGWRGLAHIRITLKKEHSTKKVQDLASALTAQIAKARN